MYARACELLKDAHAVFKNNTTDCFRICFVKQGGGGGSRIFKGSKRGDIPRVEGGSRFIYGIQKGGHP